MNETLTLNCPITKIDEEQRIVYGYATVEEIDSQGDIVDYDASKAAFPKWMQIGNIREMHDKARAVGKGFDVQFDDEKKGVLLGAKISRSADGENAWQKVKEGILTGFSIGGRMNTVKQEMVKQGDKETKVRRVMDYDLSEVSLVDSPAAPSAKFVMIKRFDGQLQPAEVIEHAPEPHNAQWWNKYYNYGAGAQMIEKINTTYDKSMEKKDYSDKERKAMADKGEAMPDGSFPIANEADLKNAVKAYGRAKDKDAAKAHIIKRAKALGLTKDLPDDWETKGAEATMKKQDDAQVETPAEQSTTPEVKVNKPGEQQVGEQASHDAPQITTAQRAADANDPNGEGAEDLQPGPDNDGNPTPDEHPVKTTAEATAQAEAGDPVKPGEAVQADSNTETPKADVAIPAADADAETHTDPEADSVKADKPEFKKFEKGLGGVAQLASVIDQLAWLRDSAKYEESIEGDGSDVSKKLSAAIGVLGELLNEYAAEEVAEAAAGSDASEVSPVMAYSMNPADLSKAIAAGVAAALEKTATKTDDDLAKSASDKLDKVVSLTSSLDDRLKRLENSPVGKTAVRYQDIHKVADGAGDTKEAQIDALIEKGTHAKTHDERGEILAQIRKLQRS